MGYEILSEFQERLNISLVGDRRKSRGSVSVYTGNP